MLAVCEKGLAVHQLDDDFSFPQGFLDEIVVFRFRHGQLQCACHIANTVYIVFGFCAEPSRQFIGVILVARQVSSSYRHAADAAAVVLDRAGAVHDVAILVQRVIREKAFTLRFGWNFLCFLRNHFLRLRFLDFFWYRFCGQVFRLLGIFLGFFC